MAAGWHRSAIFSHPAQQMDVASTEAPTRHGTVCVVSWLVTPRDETRLPAWLRDRPPRGARSVVYRVREPSLGPRALAVRRPRALTSVTSSRARSPRPAGKRGGRRWRRCSGNSSAAPSARRRRPSPDRSTPACPTRRRGRSCRARASRPRLRAACAGCTCRCPSRSSCPRLP